MNKFSNHLAVIFLMTIASLAITEKVSITVLYWYVGASFLTFMIYAIDKRKAIKGRWRTPEKILHILAFVGGWPGAVIAQQLLRHKSQKRSFRFKFWLTVVINIGVSGWLLWSKNERFFDILL